MQRCHLSACLRHLEVALAPGGGLDPEHAQQVIRLNSFQILITVMRYARYRDMHDEKNMLTALGAADDLMVHR
jgi:hypothetical protein